MKNNNEAPLISEHSYDGIQEFDNPLPGWWKMLFVLSIIFSVLYLAYFHGGAPGRTIIDQYDRALAENMRLQFEEIGELTPDRETIITYMNDPKWVAFGKSVFLTNCKSCHGIKGEGKIGPNLCDDHWKNVKTIEDVAKVVREGAAGNAMPAWGSRLHVNEIVLVSAYVASLRGSLPPGSGKPAEGKVIPAWDAVPEKPAKKEAPPEEKTSKPEPASSS